MNTDLEALPGTSAGVGTIAGLLRRGFDDEPVQKWLFPNRQYRKLASELWFRGLIKEALLAGNVWYLEDYSTAAVWFKPGIYGSGMGLTAKLFELIIKLNQRTARIKQELDHELEVRRPQEPHWYLAAVATEARYRNQGRARKVLYPVLDVCDQAHILAYLETSTSLSIKFYESLGFNVWNRFSLHDGPEVWCMGRKASKLRS